MPQTRRPSASVLTALATLAFTVALASTAEPADRPARKKILVELYTSQG
ncbi:MAG: hypothetical protein U0835_07715 [Isosphaeraceae bacterium]